MRSVKLLILFLLVASSARPAEPLYDSANAAYLRGEFELAAKRYESVAETGKVSAALYFNTGNAYFKMGELGAAILNYERAQRLSPGAEDIRENLEFARNRTEDKIDESQEMFLQEAARGLHTLQGEKGWSITAIMLLTAGLLLVALFFISRKPLIRKTLFFSGLSLLLFSALSLLTARSAFQELMRKDEAVILSSSATVVSAPAKGSQGLFVLHEGTKVSILSASGGWTEIRLPNGKTGWLSSSDLVII
jgi:tetratricopeptide (TPR) repeat protein